MQWILERPLVDGQLPDLAPYSFDPTAELPIGFVSIPTTGLISYYSNNVTQITMVSDQTGDTLSTCVGPTSPSLGNKDMQFYYHASF